MTVLRSLMAIGLGGVLATACRPPEAGTTIATGSVVEVVPAGIYELRGTGATEVIRLLVGSDGWAEFTASGMLRSRTYLSAPAPGELLFRDAGGPMACRIGTGPIEGRYRVELTEFGRHLHLIEDSCQGRRELLEGGLLVEERRGAGRSNETTV